MSGDRYFFSTESEYIARQTDGLICDHDDSIRRDTPYSSEFRNPWGNKECPNRIFIYGTEMATWFHLPDLEGYGNAEPTETKYRHDEYLPYDEFERFAMEQGWN